MKQDWLLILSVSVFLFSGCKKKQDEPGPINHINEQARVYPSFQLEKEDTLSDEEYKVYADFFSTNVNGARVINLSQQTNHWNTIPENSYFDTLRKTHGEFDSTTFANYHTANNKAYILGNKINLPSAKVVLIPSSEFTHYFSHKDPFGNEGLEHGQGLYNKYSEGYYSVSRVGFNAGKTEALISISYSSGQQQGSGLIALLKKINGRWVVIHEMNHWLT